MISIHERILFDLQPGMPEVTILVEPPVTVQGRVLDPNGNPLADATVRLVHPAGQSPPTRGERWRNMTYTKRDGRFSIELPSSDNQEYNLMVHDGGRRPIEGGQYRFDDKEWRTWANGVGPLMKTVAGQKIDNVELRVTRPGAIRGRVVNQERKPVAGVALQSIATDGQEGTIHNPAAQSDREGWFELRLVRPGRHRLQGRDGGKIPSTSDPPQPIVDVRSGETTNVGDVLISPGD
jgi:hypothetical protein